MRRSLAEGGAAVRPRISPWLPIPAAAPHSRGGKVARSRLRPSCPLPIPEAPCATPAEDQGDPDRVSPLHWQRHFRNIVARIPMMGRRCADRQEPCSGHVRKAPLRSPNRSPQSPHPSKASRLGLLRKDLSAIHHVPNGGIASASRECPAPARARSRCRRCAPRSWSWRS